jgi:hypothetical protein
MSKKQALKEIVDGFIYALSRKSIVDSLLRAEMDEFRIKSPYSFLVELKPIKHKLIQLHYALYDLYDAKNIILRTNIHNKLAELMPTLPVDDSDKLDQLESRLDELSDMLDVIKLKTDQIDSLNAFKGQQVIINTEFTNNISSTSLTAYSAETKANNLIQTCNNLAATDASIQQTLTIQQNFNEDIYEKLVDHNNKLNYFNEYNQINDVFITNLRRRMREAEEDINELEDEDDGGGGDDGLPDPPDFNPF